MDRIESLIHRLRTTDKEAKLHVLYSLIDKTIDVCPYRRMKGRLKWLEFLLDAAPNFSQYEETEALQEKLAQSLAR